MIKILHLNNYISYTSGVTRYIYNIINNTREFFEHEIFCLGGDAIERFRNLNINVTVIKDKGSHTIINTYTTLLRYFNKNNFDIVHNHHRLFDTITSFIPNRNFKTITTVHSKVYGRKFLSYRADKLIPCSDAIKNHLMQYFEKPFNKIQQMKNFIDQSDIRVEIQKEKLIEKLGIKGNKLMFFIGRFSKEKGVDILIQAFKEIYNLNNKIALIMIGEGEEENFLRSISSENKLSVIILKPQINIYNYYNIADFVVLPSRVDPFPFIMLETGMMRKPFIGSNVDGIPELIKHKVNGVLFQSENVNELVSSIQMILEDKVFAQQIADNLYNDVVENYTAEKIIPEYINFYNSLV